MNKPYTTIRGYKAEPHPSYPMYRVKLARGVILTGTLDQIDELIKQMEHDAFTEAQMSESEAQIHREIAHLTRMNQKRKELCGIYRNRLSQAKADMAELRKELTSIRNQYRKAREVALAHESGALRATHQ